MKFMCRLGVASEQFVVKSIFLQNFYWRVNSCLIGLSEGLPNPAHLYFTLLFKGYKTFHSSFLVIFVFYNTITDYTTTQLRCEFINIILDYFCSGAVNSACPGDQLVCRAMI